MKPTALPVGFRAVKAHVLGRIRSGEWPAGHTLPPEVELAETLQSARATINRALQELADEGWLDRKRKSGTKVREAPQRHARLEIPIVRHEVEAAGAIYSYALVNRKIIQAPAWLAARCKLSTGAKVLHLQSLHSADDTAFQFENRWISLATVPAAARADFKTTSPGEWLVNNMPFTSASFHFGAEEAPHDIAKMLNCEVAAAVFVGERTTWLDTQCITHARMHFKPGYRMSTRI